MKGGARKLRHTPARPHGFAAIGPERITAEGSPPAGGRRTGILSPSLVDKKQETCYPKKVKAGPPRGGPAHKKEALQTMQTSKRSLSLALILILVLTLALPAMAAGEESFTRGDAVLALYGACGEKGEYPQADFNDVPAEGELAEAVNWAAAKGIILGYGNGAFGAADPVTREQLAAILYRCAQLQGKGFQGMWMFLLDYPDAGEISSYADEAMHWVVMKGILNTDVLLRAIIKLVLLLRNEFLRDIRNHLAFRIIGDNQLEATRQRSADRQRRYGF